MDYKKQAITTQEMIDKLQARGLIFSDLDFARMKLRNINYYRLSAYWYPYLIDKHIDDGKFEQGTSFEQILEQYDFDSELRRLILETCELIEVSLRRTWSSEIGLKYGAFAHARASLNENRKRWSKTIETLQREYNKNSEDFVKHHQQNYPDLLLPPIWVTAEITTLGTLSSLIQNLRDLDDRQAISKQYSLDESILISFLRHLSDVRNICAHYGRLWNRKFLRRFQFPKHHKPGIKLNFNNAKYAENKIYNTIQMLSYFEFCIDDEIRIIDRVNLLLAKYPNISSEAMGFPLPLIEGADA